MRHDHFSFLSFDFYILVFFCYQKYYACLPARYTTDKSGCYQDSDCSAIAELIVKRRTKQTLDLNKNEQVCLKPVNENGTHLIRIVTSKGQPILYVGSVKELMYSSK
mgnify:CR=1 FL=1